MTSNGPDLGSSEAEHPEPGEVIFVDQEDVVSARRAGAGARARGVARGRTRPRSSVTVEGHHATADPDVTRALADLEALLVMYALPDAIRTAVLSADDPEFGDETRAADQSSEASLKSCRAPVSPFSSYVPASSRVRCEPSRRSRVVVEMRTSFGPAWSSMRAAA